MPARSTPPPIARSRRGLRVYVRPPRKSDAPSFVAAVTASRPLHRGWVHPPATPAGYAAFVRRYATLDKRAGPPPNHVGLLVCRHEDDSLVGVFNISEIVRGLFNSGYLGYYAFAAHAGHGYMTEGLELVLRVAFKELRLHRLEANVQPSNGRSLAFVRRAGFVREGFSRRYVRIGGQWRDHVRLALLAEDWRARRRKTRA